MKPTAATVSSPHVALDPSGRAVAVWIQNGNGIEPRAPWAARVATSSTGAAAAVWTEEVEVTDVHSDWRLWARPF